MKYIKKVDERPLYNDGIGKAAGFDMASINHLMDDLKGYGISTNLWAKGQIGIKAETTPQFLEWIGPCPDPIKDIYGYKWGRGL